MDVLSEYVYSLRTSLQRVRLLELKAMRRLKRCERNGHVRRRGTYLEFGRSLRRSERPWT